VRLADVAALPVVDNFHTHMNFPQDHPLHAGFDSTPYLDEADAFVVVESDAPWFPQLKSPRPDAKLVQIGVDPSSRAIRSAASARTSRWQGPCGSRSPRSPTPSARGWTPVSWASVGSAGSRSTRGGVRRGRRRRARPGASARST